MLFLLLYCLLVGCGGIAPVIGLYPAREIDSVKTNGRICLCQVEAFEVIKSDKVPVLLNNGLLRPHKNKIWLRSPAQLVEEYFSMVWRNGGGSIADDQMNKNNVYLELRAVYLDQATNKYKVDLYAVMNGKSKLIQCSGEKLIKTVRTAVVYAIEFVQKNIS